MSDISSPPPCGYGPGDGSCDLPASSPPPVGFDAVDGDTDDESEQDDTPAVELDNDLGETVAEIERRMLGEEVIPAETWENGSQTTRAAALKSRLNILRQELDSESEPDDTDDLPHRGYA